MSTDPRRTTLEAGGRAALSGTAWASASYLMPFLFTLAVSVVAARVLGPDEMGRQSFISFVVQTVMLVCAGGLPAALVRFTGELIGAGRSGAVLSLVSWAWRIQAIGAIAGGVTLVALAAAGEEPRAAWLFGALAVVFGVLQGGPASVLTGAQRWRESSSALLVVGAAGAAATVVALLLGGGITGMFVVLACTSASTLVWTYLLMRRTLRDLGAAPASLGQTQGRAARYAAATTVPVILSLVVYQRSEFFFLEASSTNAQIALYSIAFAAASALGALPKALSRAAYPAVSTLFGAGEFDRIRTGFARAVRLTLLLTLPLTAGALALGPQLLRLFYGEEYEGAGEVFVILAAPLPLMAAGSIAGSVISGYGRMRFPIVVGVVAAVIDIGLASALVPPLDAVGAAVANIAAQLVAVVLGGAYAIRLAGTIEVSPTHLLRMGAASAAGAGCALLALRLGDGVGPFLVAVAAGCGSFAVLALILRVLPRKDAEWLADRLDNRTGRYVGRICLRLSGAPLGAAR
jgi:O-antigen/teichoic acid export membrane protein